MKYNHWLSDTALRDVTQETVSKINYANYAYKRPLSRKTAIECALERWRKWASYADIHYYHVVGEEHK